MPEAETGYYPCKKCKCPDYRIVDETTPRTLLACKCCGKQRYMSKSFSKFAKRDAAA